MLHQINQPCFAWLSNANVGHGWSVFPQTRLDGRRGPGSIDGHPIKWKVFQDRRPSTDELADMNEACPAHNVAGIMGRASGNVFALDVDIPTLDLSVEIQLLADRYLGYTPLRRVGAPPRIALLYRQGDPDEIPADQIIPSRSFPLKGDRGAVEILAHGKPLTFHGLHHKTGDYIRWIDASPHLVGPEAAPLVSRKRLDAFLDALDDLVGLQRRVVAPLADTHTWDPSQALHRPAQVGGEVTWTVEAGKVTDGREAFMFALARSVVRVNEGVARDQHMGLARLANLVEAEALARVELSGRWHAGSIRDAAIEKVRASIAWHLAETGRFARPLDAGPIVAITPAGDDVHAPSVPADAPEPTRVHELAHLREGDAARISRTAFARKPPYMVIQGPDRVRAMGRAIITDEDLRLGAARDAVRTVAAHEARWIDGLYERAALRRERECRGDRTPLDAAPIQIVKGDAGVGKTSSFWRQMADAKRVNGPLGYPVGFAMPSHANIEDSLSGARAAGHVSSWERDVAEAVQAGAAEGLNVVIFRGKLRTNCGYRAQVAALQEASIGAQRLCESRIDRNAGVPGADPEWEVVRCPMWESCEYQASLQALPKADVVLFASSYLAVTPPVALTKTLIGLVVDERPYSNLLGTNSGAPMPIAVLAKERAAPRLTKEEKAPYEHLADPREAFRAIQESYLAERNWAVSLMRDALGDGDAAGAVMALHGERGPQGERLGLAWAQSAKIVCSRGADLARAVAPGMTEQAAADLAATPRGEGIWDERRFWSVVVERLEALRDDEEQPGTPRRAHGDSDARLQCVVHTGPAGDAWCLRMSWRVEPSFPGLPLMMLDASAAPAIVEKIWSDRSVEVLPVQAPSHMRAVLVTGGPFSDRSMLPSRARDRDELMATAKTVEMNRRIIERLSGVHGHGRTLVGGNKPVMAVLRHSWKPPTNTDFVHNGGMRGLDFAKNHAAAILFGRLELPPRAVDAYVAALTYDDPDPEQPVDALGTGLDAKGDPLRPVIGEKRVAMRDGSDISVKDAVYVGPWATLIQRQFREEEVRQFAARLRPVHRTGRPPVVYLACSAIPEGMVVDEVVDVRQLETCGDSLSAQPWSIARATDGVLDVEGTGWYDREDLDGHNKSIREWRVAPLRLDEEAGPETGGLTRIRWRLGAGAWTTSSVLTEPEDPVAPLRAILARETGVEESELDLDVEVLRQGNPRLPSGTRAPDAIDLAHTGLPAGSTREEVRQALADAEDAQREAAMAEERHALSGTRPGATYEAILAGLKARRIEGIYWSRVRPYPDGDRKLGAVSIAVRALARSWGVDAMSTVDDDPDD
ncbi:bifunctional DNA primase/polymerase [Methylobacterium sp. WL6]|uniref:bifunctional DNA primase/polymerase n=1 Tax=Methylobacterium sp. WL6 TaxID=2603901 RepID=UPI00164F2833|nr:bifunctional DNA primase/polymerase [Methylobacterium sp. WL6]